MLDRQTKAGGDLADFGMFTGESTEPGHVLHHLGLLQKEIQLLQPDGIALKLLTEKWLHGRGCKG